MTVCELIEKLSLEIVTCNDDYNKNINGCYVSDLLSLVMSRGQNDSVWVTVQTNINIVAVATLIDVSCIIIAENMDIDEQTVNKASLQDVIILRSDKTSYELACEISKVL